MATIEIKLKPWSVPEHATSEAGPNVEEMRVPVRDLSSETLQAMAHEWLCSLYDVAGKPYNWRFD